MRKNIYIPVLWKFWISQAVAISWTALSLWFSIPWVYDLEQIVGHFWAFFIVGGLAYVPGYLNAFLVISLLFDRQPDFKINNSQEAVSVLIAARNEATNIQDTLHYISRQDYAGTIHVILVNNGSTDDTVQITSETARHLNMQLTILDEERPGKHIALNTGLDRVQTDLVITLDADTLLHPAAVRYVVSRLRSAPDDVCAVAGSILVRNSRQTFWTRLQEWDYFLGIASIKRLQGLYQGTLVAQGAFSLYKTEAIVKAGGWPDAIGEDIVLTWKFFEQHYRVYFEPLAVAFTNAPVKFTHFVRQRNRWARGMIEALKQVRPWKQPRLFSKFLTGIDLLIPYIDFSYTCFWIPGLILAFFGYFWIIGLTTLLVLPLTLISYYILYVYQRRVFKALHLAVRKNIVGFIAYVLIYQMIMAPISVYGYIQELLHFKRVWK
ncbi:glycosyltransferase family 2 protein [Aneurinibacillus uraniidurans]|uniref:glycosyltransferase family 2 protein n=1 Tax=Aneurinibacillus uraniidurans TaxID=2966586 RepID=UPI00234A0CE1|nr:glycosyltransferase [Aneurinibacillus sp. B1]WCN39244.1 glycosyltransferase [Aneurinibacillus sp. B1]